MHRQQTTCYDTRQNLLAEPREKKRNETRKFKFIYMYIQITLLNSFRTVDEY